MERIERPKIDIKRFIGGKTAALEFREWRDNVEENAYRQVIPNASGSGLLAFTMTDQQWAAHRTVRTRKLGAFHAIAHPGEVAEDPEDTYDVRLKRNDIFLGRYLAEQRALLEFTKAVVDSLDASSRRLLADPGGGTAVMSKNLQEIMATLEARYSRVPPSQIGHVASQLTTPYVPASDVLGFFAKHTEVHRILALSGEEMPEPFKIRTAKEALFTGSPKTFTTAHDMFEEDCRKTGAVPTWLDYSDAMVAASLRSHEDITTGTAGFDAGFGAAAAQTGNQTFTGSMLYGNQTPSHNEPPAWFASAMAAEYAKHNSDDRGKGGAKGGGGARVQTAPQPRVYCHTHGLCAHTSKECKKQGPNHEVNATTPGTTGNKKGMKPPST
jgi:hypothetical protein